MVISWKGYYKISWFVGFSLLRIGGTIKLLFDRLVYVIFQYTNNIHPDNFR